MGNTETGFNTRFRSLYNFIQILEDRNFGTVKIYRKVEINYDYVMILERYIEKQEMQKFKVELEIIQKRTKEENPPLLLKVYCFQIVERQFHGCSLPVARMYIEYFNFTLLDYLNILNERKKSLSYQQIIYILKQTMRTYQFFSEFNSNISNFALSSIYLTPEGCLRFIPIRIADFHHQPNSICSNICEKQNVRHTINFERTSKHFISQLKKLIGDINKQLNKKVDPKIIVLGQNIRACRSFGQVRAALNNEKGQLQCLLLEKNANASLMSSVIGQEAVDKDLDSMQPQTSSPSKQLKKISQKVNYF